ncbi:MAG: porin family protein [Lewinellaceae bacterium]|nr:porin family protein [Lewinellaceae bacterium]
MSKEFDEILKEKLNQISQTNRMDWEGFSDKLDKEFIQEKEFDELISKALSSRKSTRPTNSHWQLLKEKLELQERRINSIYISKSIELALIFLVFFFIHSFGLLKSPNTESYYYAATKKYNESLIKNSEEAQYQYKEAYISNAIDNAKIIVPVDSREIKPKVKEFAELPPLRNTRHIASSDKININIEQQKIFTEVEKIDITSTQVDSQNSLNLNTYDSEERKNDKSNKQEISNYVNVNSVSVNTPFDIINNLPSYSNSTYAVTYGLEIKKNITDHLSGNFGVEYTKFVYSPSEAYQFPYIDNVANLSQIKLNVLSIPLALQYSFDLSNRLSAYFKGGIKLNIVADSEYEIDNKRTNGNRFDQLAANNNLLLEKEFSAGLLEGGNFKDNYFTSLMLAVGLDYNISDKLKINLEPNLTRFVSTGGIGPNDDKINTLGLKMGVKYIL